MSLTRHSPRPPRPFICRPRKDLDACLDTVAKLENFCDEKLEDDAPGFTKLRTALTDVRHSVHLLLEKKREKEPDPVEVVAPEPAARTDAEAQVGDGRERPTSQPGIGPADWHRAHRMPQAIAGDCRGRRLHAQEASPAVPAPYLLLRGLRWGELRSARAWRQPVARSAVNRSPPADQASGHLPSGGLSCSRPVSRPWPCREAVPGSICSGSPSPPATHLAMSTSPSQRPFNRNSAHC